MSSVTVKATDGLAISFEFAECVGVSDKQAAFGDSCKTKAFERLASFLLSAAVDKREAFLAKYEPQLAAIKADTNAKGWIEGEQDIRERIKALLAK
ncbi:MAG: hypothetical protein WC455_28390 [Dehalococcoidia bacterium]|jgi:hypothetical protein